MIEEYKTGKIGDQCEIWHEKTCRNSKKKCDY